MTTGTRLGAGSEEFVTRVHIIGPGRAGTSLHQALARAGVDVAPLAGRDDEPAAATADADVVVIATPDAAVADVARRLPPGTGRTVVHLSGSLGLGPLAGHPRRGVLHPLVALPDPDLGAPRLRGAWFGVAAGGDPVVLELVAALGARPIEVPEDGWARYHAAAVVASNHLVALLGQVERIAATVGAPLDAYLELSRGTLDNVAALGPAAALTGPVRRGDTATVQRHLDALSDDERPAYRALAAEAARLC